MEDVGGKSQVQEDEGSQEGGRGAKTVSSIPSSLAVVSITGRRECVLSS